MPKLEYFLVCESLAKDSKRDSVSLFHVLNDVRMGDFPDVFPQLAVVSAWICSEHEIRTKHECQIKVEFRLPGDPEPAIFRGNMACKVRHQNFVYQFEGIPIKQPGDLIIAIYLDDVESATHTITISPLDTGEEATE